MKALYVSRLRFISWFVIWTIGWSLYLPNYMHFRLGGFLLCSSGFFLKTREEWSQRMTAKDLVGLIIAIALFFFVAFIAALNLWVPEAWGERFVSHPLFVLPMYATGVCLAYRGMWSPKTQGTGPNLAPAS
jgi:hypothetical protein